MRRVGLLVLFLLALSLTTAFAASMDVQADNLSSTRMSVSIDVPGPPDGPPILYLVTPTTDQPNSLAEELDDNQQTWGMTAGTYRDWETSVYPAGLRYEAKYVNLILYTNGASGGSGTTTATILDCEEDVPLQATDGCVELIASSLEWTTNGFKTMHFPPPTSTPVTLEIAPGHKLRLRIANEEPSGSWNIQWGKTNPDRDSRLLFSDSPLP